MHLEPGQNQKIMQESIARFLNTESSIARVRAASGSGFDARLWQGLAELGMLTMRTSESSGGLGLGVFDAALAMEEVGRTLASGPICETIVAARFLSQISSAHAVNLLDQLGTGKSALSIAFKDIEAEPVQLVAGAGAASAIVGRKGDAIVVIQNLLRSSPPAPIAGVTQLSLLDLSASETIVLAQGPAARRAFAAAIEEWKLLTASALVGLSAEALRLAADYAKERQQFGRPIGSFQAVSHPLAQSAVETDAGRLMVWRAIQSVSRSSSKAGAEISAALWWASEMAERAVARALHTFGGYGVTTEYDIHLYNLRAKTWPLVLGDPDELLEESGRRLFLEEEVHLPDAGEMTINFDLGDDAAALAGEVQAFFDANLTDEKRARRHFSWEGHDAELHKKLAEAGLLFPGWPKRLGGRDASRYAVVAARDIWDEVGWTTFPQMTAEMIGLVIDRFGNQTLKDEVLQAIVAGEATIALAFSEPHSGSDVFAAKTKAIPDGDDWIIEGQKMFTTGANIADYAILLARTETGGQKHAGLTVFIVPLQIPEVTIQAVETFQDERTNITFYNNVRIPDHYRLGSVGEGAKVMAASLEAEQGNSFVSHHRRLVRAAENFCRSHEKNNAPMLHDPHIIKRLARAAANLSAAEVLDFRVLWSIEENRMTGAWGSASKMFSSEIYRADSADLLNLTAPASLAGSCPDTAYINHCYRQSQITVTYGGTTEIHRSVIAEKQLGVPRSR